MVREIVKDTIVLSRKSIAAVSEDAATARDLLDTLQAHSSHCVGMAANMIGVNKCIIAVLDGASLLPMLNPVISKRSAKTYYAVESCLSVPGEQRVLRYASIEVKYRDLEFRKQRQKFSGLTAEIIQHEIDHCNGILV